MFQIRIENRHTYNGKGVYVGRPSVLGNTFRIGRDGDRKTVIKKNLRWLRKKYIQRGAVYRELHRLAEMARREDLILICWCEAERFDLSRVICGSDLWRVAPYLCRCPQPSSVAAP